jgi:hypothetical protein
MKPADVADGYAQQLTAAGIRATCDPGLAVPPCVLFEPPQTVRMDVYCGGSARMTCVVVARGGPSNRSEWQQLDALLSQVLAADVLPVTDVDLVSLDIDGAPGAPAYRLTWDEVVSWN